MNVPDVSDQQQALLPVNQSYRLSLLLRKNQQGPELVRTPIPVPFIRDLKNELFMTFALRRGMPAATLDDVSIQLTPLNNDQGAGCRGVRAEVRNGRGESFQRDYPCQVFADAAAQVAQQLIADGRLNIDDTYQYELLVEEPVVATSASPVAGISFRQEAKQEPLQFLVRPLKPMLADAEAVGVTNDEHFTVFYTTEALARAERYARRGATSLPPRETGALLVGTACSCPETGEFYLVVTDALEAADAKEDKISLAYTGKTWLRLQAVLKSIQSQPETRSYRFLGQAHGHNFVPLDGAPPCEMCSAVKECSRTSVFVSVDDRRWTQAVFGSEPYALCHIFGLNARHEEVQGLYSLLSNRLTQRGYYVISHFDP